MASELSFLDQILRSDGPQRLAMTSPEGSEIVFTVKKALGLPSTATPTRICSTLRFTVHHISHLPTGRSRLPHDIRPTCRRHEISTPRELILSRSNKSFLALMSIRTLASRVDWVETIPEGDKESSIDLLEDEDDEDDEDDEQGGMDFFDFLAQEGFSPESPLQSKHGNGVRAADESVWETIDKTPNTSTSTVKTSLTMAEKIAYRRPKSFPHRVHEAQSSEK